MFDQKFMELAIQEAKASYPDVPVGALLVSQEGRMLAKASNRRVRDSDPSAHAELLVLREASKDIEHWKLEGCTLYVTLEPCAMCAAAISDSRISKVVFGAFDERLGAAGSKYDILRDTKHGASVEVVGGFLQEECSELLSNFFSLKRE